MKKVLITGAGGQLGSTLAVQSVLYDVFSFNKKQLNVVNKQEVFQVFKAIKPHFVIHTAAYTNVDESEVNKRIAFEVNCDGTENIALACKKWDSVMIYMSTDYVFDGKKKEPYTEEDVPNPVNWYGLTKLIGEETVKVLLDKYFILRTSWLYGPSGKNFVKTILEMAETSLEIKVVNDQMGCPTYVKDLCKVIFQLIEVNGYGIYHASNVGVCSWYDFANSILKMSGNKETFLLPISSEELNRLAIRPHNSALQNTKSVYTMPEWKEALEDFMKTDHE
jgi:dTDP-4-dehydrorhamnose reductase